MTNPQTEARAIARKYTTVPAEDRINLSREIATALAAKDAELAEATAWMMRAIEERKEAEAQLAEANKALDEIAKPGVGASSDWSLEECERYWFSQARDQREIARRAREAQGGGNV